MAYSNRIWIYGPVGLLVLAGVLYSVFWRAQADMLAAKLDSANGGEIVPGIVFAFADKTVGGFPFRLDAVLTGVTFTDRRPDGERAWRTEQLAIHTLAYRNSLIVFEVAGLQSFALPGERGGAQRVIHITPAVARASAVINDGRLARFDLDLRELEATDARAEPAAERSVSASRAQFHLMTRPDDTIDLALSIENAAIGKGFEPRLQGALALADLRGRLMQSAPFAALAEGRGSFFDALERWRASGGKIEVERLTLDWAGMKTELKGALGVDETHRLAGELLGSLDAGSLARVLSGGALNLQGVNAAVPISLRFRGGDIEAGLN